MSLRSLYSAFPLVAVLLIIGTTDLYGQDPLISSWVTTGDDTEITLPINGAYTYNYDVDWDGDGVYDSLNVTGEITHDYGIADTFTIRIRGNYPHIRFGWSPDKEKLISIDQWGDIAWSSMNYAFLNCENMHVWAVDTPNLTGLSDLHGMFRGCEVMNEPVEHWDVSNVTHFSQMFRYAYAFNQPLEGWDMTSAVSTGWMFYAATSFNQPLNGWDMSNVEDIALMFRAAWIYNQPLDQWNTSNVNSGYQVFFQAYEFDQNIGAWDISNFGSMENMLTQSDISVANYDSTLIGWRTLDPGESIPMNLTLDANSAKYCLADSVRTDLETEYNWTFNDAGYTSACFLPPAEDHLVLTFVMPNTSDIDSTSITLPKAPGSGYDYGVDWDNDGEADTLSLNNSITLQYSAGDTVTIRILGTFPRIYFAGNADAFKLYRVDQWGENTWTSMHRAFEGCTNLVSLPDEAPNLDSLTSLELMFGGATSFNQNLAHWDVDSVEDMRQMFLNASAFDQNLGDWDISSAVYMNLMFNGSGMSMESYDSTLIGWRDLQPGESIPSGITLGAQNISYCAGKNAHDTLDINYNWNFVDGGYDAVCLPVPGPSGHFVTTWKSGPDGMVTIPVHGSPYYYYHVDWNNDGVFDSLAVSGSLTHDFGMEDTFTIRIAGMEFPRIYFNNGSEAGKLLSVDQWGDVAWQSMERAFFGCSNLVITAVDTPNFDAATNFHKAFQDCSALTSGIGHWDMSSVTNMWNAFAGCTNMNDDLGDWDMSSVLTMQSAFGECDAFVGTGLENWDVSSVTNMANMFIQSDNFNGDVSTWDVSNVQDFSWMFSFSTMFDQNLGGWDLSSATTLSYTLNGVKLSTSNYDMTLIGWATLDPGETQIPSGLTAWMGSSQYCDAGAARNTLINTYSWTIYDNGAGCPGDFVIGWYISPDHSDNMVEIPTFPGETYNYEVDWDNDGVIDQTGLTGNVTHDYGGPGFYTTRIRGDFPRVYFNDMPDADKLRDIKQWGDTEWTSMAAAFKGCQRISITADDHPDFSGLTDLSSMFAGCDFEPFNSNAIPEWDVSNVTTIDSFLANQGTVLTFNINNWDISSLTSARGLFYGTSLWADHYDSLLAGWSTLGAGESQIPMNLDFGGGNNFYCAGESDRSTLTSTYNWNIVDAGKSCMEDHFVTTWQTDLPGNSDDFSIVIPTTGDGYLYDVDINNDGVFDYFGLTGDGNIEFEEIGTYTIRIRGSFPRIHFDGYRDNWKITSVDQWGSNQWTTMKRAFSGCSNLEIMAVDTPDFSGLTSLEKMFEGANSISADISHWDVSTVADMTGLFINCYAFNQPLEDWDVSNVTNMQQMFAAATTFNQPLNAWDVSSVDTMLGMFGGASAFNQPLHDWNVSNVVDMAGMFQLATAFAQNIGMWDISSLQNASSMFWESALTEENYDSLLIGWNRLDPGEAHIPANVEFEAGSSFYCAGKAAHESLIRTHGWTIVDRGSNCYEDHFVTKWFTGNSGGSSNTSIYIPTYNGASYNFDIDWDNDGVFDVSNQTGSVTHDFGVEDTVTIRIRGVFPRIYFNGEVANDRYKILSIEQWGYNPWTSMSYAFEGCTNLEIAATDAPNLWGVSSMNDMFRSCLSMNSNIDHWDVSNVINMESLFYRAVAFNQPLNSWDVGNVTNMSAMFHRCDNFNQPLNDWDVSNVTAMPVMFYEAFAFNQPLDNWDVGKVENLASMFSGATSFDQDLGDWDVSSLLSAANMFYGAQLSIENYDSLLIGWLRLDPGESVLNNSVSLGAHQTYYCAGDAAHQELVDNYGWTITDRGRSCLQDHFVTTWKTDTTGGSGPTSITIPTNALFTYNYDIDINNDGDFDILGVTGDTVVDLGSSGTHQVRIRGDFPAIRFEDLTSKDKLKLLSVDQWGSAEWKSMSKAFAGCEQLEVLAIDTPNTSMVTNFIETFYNCYNFNTNVNGWDVSSGGKFFSMFNGCALFNQPMDTWEMGNAQFLDGMFAGCTAFNQPLASWNFSNLESVSSMFYNAEAFNQPIGGWDVSGVGEFGGMFYGASSFNQPIGDWDISSSYQLDSMFYGASAFDQDIGDWNISSVTMSGIFWDVHLSVANYDSLLIGWARLDPGETGWPGSVTLDLGTSNYCAGAPWIDFLQDIFDWTINDGGQRCESEWTGAVNSNWFDAGNWSAGVPTAGWDAIIPDVSPNQFPVINAPNAKCRDLEIKTGASVTVLPSGQLIASED